MATLTNGWYKGSIPFYEITEIEIASNGAGSESWDGSASQDGSIVCYRNGTKVKIVSTNITEIGEKAFYKFIALKKVSGLGSVTTIGTFAFCYTPNIVSIDIVPSNITSIGESAFRMSSAEDNLDLSSISLDIVGNKATRHKRWDTSSLNAVQSIVFPRTIYLDTPNLDCQFNYPDVQWGVQNGTTLYVDMYGCSSFAAYHIWNCLHAGTEKQYDNWLDWYNDTINADGTFAENNPHDSQTTRTIITKLGWIPQQPVYVSSGEQLQTVIDRLMMGWPTHAVIHSSTFSDSYHSVAIIGCNADTHKLAVVDSSALNNVGIVSWIAFEDMFVGGTSETDKIFLVDYNRPMLAPNCTWFTQGGTTVKRASITEIYIEDSYAPTEAITDSWDASAAKNGSIMAYVEGTRLTLAGNGSGKITLNPDSSRVFTDVNKVDFFENLTEIHNTNLLDTAQATTFERMCEKCYALKRLDGTGWNTGNVTSLLAMFQYCSSLGELRAENWDTSSVNTLTGFLNMNTSNYANSALKELDLSGWSVDKVTNMRLFMCYLIGLESLNLSGWNIRATSYQACLAELRALKELDLSGFDTTQSSNMADALRNPYSLQKITLGDKFSFDGNGSLTGSAVCVRPTPNGAYVDGADGNWYDVNGNAIAPSAIPNRTFGVYYATQAIAEEDANEMVLVKKGNLIKTAAAIRTKTGSKTGYAPADFADAILSS